MTEQPPTADGPLLAELVELWRRTCADFVGLVRDLPRSQWDIATDLPGWTVKDTVAHVAHLESVLAGAPDETAAVTDAGQPGRALSAYTELGVRARRDHDLATLVEEIERSVAHRHAELCETPPLDASAPPTRTFAGVRWDTRTLLSNRPFDVWMHEQDVRRAVGRPGGYATPAAAHALGMLGSALPMVVGKRVAPRVGTTVRLAVPDAGRRWTVRMGADGRAAPVDDATAAQVTVILGPQDFVVLAGGRRTPETTAARLQGDAELGRKVLHSLAVTP